jgi:hypothetical protein
MDNLHKTNIIYTYNMTEEQYNECQKYRGVINLFVTSGQCIGGLDGLFDYYGVRGQDRSCPACISQFLLNRHSELTQYEHDNNL